MRRMTWVLWLAGLCVLAGFVCGCVAYGSSQMSGREKTLERNLSERFPAGTPVADVIRYMERKKWSCRPIINGSMVATGEPWSGDYRDAEALVCVKTSGVVGSSGSYQVDFPLVDGRVARGIHAHATRYNPVRPEL